jgi:hypothetical protein
VCVCFVCLSLGAKELWGLEAGISGLFEVHKRFCEFSGKVVRGSSTSAELVCAEVVVGGGVKAGRRQWSE